MSRPGPSPIELVILAIADGRTLREAAAIARMQPAKATREAKAYGYPYLPSVREAAEEIRERYPTPTTDTPTPDPPSRIPGDPVPPRTKQQPVPIEPDVEDVLARGAREIEQTRAVLAPVFERQIVDELERNAAADLDLDAEGGQPQPAAEATDAPDVDDPWHLPCPDCRSTDRPCDCIGAIEPDGPGGDECTRGPLCPAAVHDPHCDEAIEQAATGGPIPVTYGAIDDADEPDVEPAPKAFTPLDPVVAAKVDAAAVADMAELLAEAQAGLTSAEKSRAARTLGADPDAMAGRGLAAAVPPAERVSDDRADLSRVLDLVERLGGHGIESRAERPLGALTVEQRARATALREAGDVLLSLGPTPGDLLAVADYITRGTVPALVVRGLLGAGGEGR